MPGAASFLERKGLVSSVLVVQGSELVRAIQLLVRAANSVAHGDGNAQVEDLRSPRRMSEEGITQSPSKTSHWVLSPKGGTT